MFYINLRYIRLQNATLANSSIYFKGQSMPNLQSFDHIHIYVKNRQQAVKWYQAVLGFSVVESLAFWAVDKGPLVVAHEDLHLALFESELQKRTTVAFGVDAANFLLWQQHLTTHEVTFVVSDHDISWSLYFSDPDGNPFEITTFDYENVVNNTSA